MVLGYFIKKPFNFPFRTGILGSFPTDWSRMRSALFPSSCLVWRCHAKIKMIRLYPSSGGCGLLKIKAWWFKIRNRNFDILLKLACHFKGSSKIDFRRCWVRIQGPPSEEVLKMWVVGTGNSTLNTSTDLEMRFILYCLPIIINIISLPFLCWAAFIQLFSKDWWPDCRRFPRHLKF